ncbi:MAG: hypothetical protein AB4042_07140 [Leptolyngbyaceae cyanobacterium]
MSGDEWRSPPPLKAPHSIPTPSNNNSQIADKSRQKQSGLFDGIFSTVLLSIQLVVRKQA